MNFTEIDVNETAFRVVTHTASVLMLCKNSLMEHDRFLHTTKREECNVSLHACGDTEQHWR